MALAIAFKTRTLLLHRGYRVAMTRTTTGYRGGNIARAQFCNVRHAALMIRIHADGSRTRACTDFPRSTPPSTAAGRTTSTRRACAPRARGAARADRRDGAKDNGLVPAATSPGSTGRTSPANLVETGSCRTRTNARCSRARHTAERRARPRGRRQRVRSARELAARPGLGHACLSARRSPQPPRPQPSLRPVARRPCASRARERDHCVQLGVIRSFDEAAASPTHVSPVATCPRCAHTRAKRPAKDFRRNVVACRKLPRHRCPCFGLVHASSL